MAEYIRGSASIARKAYLMYVDEAREALTKKITARYSNSDKSTHIRLRLMFSFEGSAFRRLKGPIAQLVRAHA